MKKPRKAVTIKFDLKEFRRLYTEIFGNSPTVEETPAVLAHPEYKKYKQMAPIFYYKVLKQRRKGM